VNNLASWVVDGSALKVFKYTLSGSLLGSWSIDPANKHPSGITINPNNVSDIWIVDNGTDKVYQYIGAASRVSGSQNAGVTFALASGNTNPQGIADPPTADMLLMPAASPVALNQPSAAVIVPSLANRDAAFVLLTQDPPQRAGEFLSEGSFTPLLNNLTPIADLAWTAASSTGGPNPLAPLALLTPMSSQGVRSDSSAMRLRDGTLAGENSEASVAAMDLASARLANKSAAEE
jgi:hypothetical protein